MKKLANKTEIKLENLKSVEAKPKKTISQLVLNLFKTQPEIRSKEMIEQVKKLFPESKFNVYHYSWYRYQIKKGRYTKLFSIDQLKHLFSQPKV